jgi:predicted transcriptional regulator
MKIILVIISLIFFSCGIKESEDIHSYVNDVAKTFHGVEESINISNKGKVISVIRSSLSEGLSVIKMECSFDSLKLTERRPGFINKIEISDIPERLLSNIVNMKRLNIFSISKFKGGFKIETNFSDSLYSDLINSYGEIIHPTNGLYKSKMSDNLDSNNFKVGILLLDEKSPELIEEFRKEYTLIKRSEVLYYYRSFKNSKLSLGSFLDCLPPYGTTP